MPRRDRRENGGSLTLRRVLTAAVAVLASVIISATFIPNSPARVQTTPLAYQTTPMVSVSPPLNPWAVGTQAVAAKTWVDGVVRAERINAFRAWITALPKPPPPVVQVVHHTTVPTPQPVTISYSTTGSVNGYPCGGSLPSCCTLSHESGGNPLADNGVGYTGLWQFGTTTWQRTWTYSSEFGAVASWVLKLAGTTSAQGVVARWPIAKDAPPDVQNEAARRLYRNGAGASNWYGDGCYNGR